MCAFTIHLLDFDKMSDTQKKTLLSNLEGKRKELKAQLDQVNRSLKGLDKSIKTIKTKGKSKRRA